ncbi:MAG: hypothetical protein ACM3U2_00395 [Deltaproteobacteria bacterium]
MRDALVQTLMADFADATGVSGKTKPRRYLWTDAFAVCNFLGLYRQTGEDRYRGLAVELVDQVHHILGRHRRDDPRHGWISGLSEEDGERHPTRGGLRIGKIRNERGPDEPADSRLEWDQDGQYFHYLTKWMHALYRMGRETGESRYQRWAAELAVAAHNAFTFEISPGGPRRMVWKMSIDLTRPLVSSMGQHDPLDALVTYLELQAADGLEAQDRAGLAMPIADTTEMCQGARWATDDPLGIGGLLDDAARLAQLVFRCGVERRQLLRQILVEAELSLHAFARSSPLNDHAAHRLAFRELGLAIGLSGLERIRDLVKGDDELDAVVTGLLLHRSLADQIRTFWSDSPHRLGRTWMEHRDINTVMLATSLSPEGYLQL